jgi:hypothetical protein
LPARSPRRGTDPDNLTSELLRGSADLSHLRGALFVLMNLAGKLLLALRASGALSLKAEHAMGAEMGALLGSLPLQWRLPAEQALSALAAIAAESTKAEQPMSAVHYKSDQRTTALVENAPQTALERVLARFAAAIAAKDGIEQGAG